MKEDGVLATPVLTKSRAGAIAATASLRNRWFRYGKRCGCKGDDLCWPWGCSKRWATGDTFSVAIAGTTISATVGAGVTAGTYGIASLVTDLNAANQALATPVAITFSASGSDMLATANDAANNIDMSAAVQRNSGSVGTSTITTRAASAVARTFDIATVHSRPTGTMLS